VPGPSAETAGPKAVGATGTEKVIRGRAGASRGVRGALGYQKTPKAPWVWGNKNVRQSSIVGRFLIICIGIPPRTRRSGGFPAKLDRQPPDWAPVLADSAPMGLPARARAQGTPRPSLWSRRRLTGCRRRTGHGAPIRLVGGSRHAGALAPSEVI
jgi:hypothetical protein